MAFFRGRAFCFFSGSGRCSTSIPSGSTIRSAHRRKERGALIACWSGRPKALVREGESFALWQGENFFSLFLYFVTVVTSCSGGVFRFWFPFRRWWFLSLMGFLFRMQNDIRGGIIAAHPRCWKSWVRVQQATRHESDEIHWGVACGLPWVA